VAYTDLKGQIQEAPKSPGIYKMADTNEKILYVGKARNLRKRLLSYLRSGLDKKTQLLLGQVASFEVTLASSESEALLLEWELIKEYRPRYNILLKDDKSYPYLFFSTEHASPRIDFVRGPKKEKGRYFGPYPSSGSVRENITLLQKIFKLRTCQDSVFKSRTRPCLQHQIDRCSAPCVAKIKETDYRGQVDNALLFLEGKDDAVIANITEKMQASAKEKQYEQAKLYRDQVSHLRGLQRSPDAKGLGRSMDAIAVSVLAARAVVSVISIRDGRLVGGRLHKPVLSGFESDKETVLAAFLSQYYLNDVRATDIPQSILLATCLKDKECLEQAFSAKWKKKIKIKDNRFSAEKEWVDLTAANADEGLSQWLHAQESVRQQLQKTQALLGLPEPPALIECFDVSHTGGDQTVASCVVFEGLQMNRKSYRRFNISTKQAAGDDYAAMKEALLRRYKRRLKEQKKLPDIVVVDGGKGQLKQAAEVMDELAITGIVLLGIAKGPARTEGQEKFFRWAGQAEKLAVAFSDPSRELFQLIRDEAHRFAITGHRARRSSTRIRSTLEDLPGVGKKRRQILLEHFGGLAELKQASAEEIAGVPGIGASLAASIFAALHA
jgi:excinuclease ABC subunit C